jgi:hypothetical protein
MTSGLFNRLDDPAGQSTDIGAAVAANFSFISDSSQRDSDKFSSQGSGD